MTALVIVVVLLLLVVALVGIALAPPTRRTVRPRRHGGARATGLPPGRVVYSDAGGTARPLAARRYPLAGKPDYVVRAPDGHHIPVEIKSTHARGGPRHEDVLQLVTYMIILDDLYRPAPRYGLLRYADATYEVPYTAELRAEVLALLAEMQALDGADLAAGEAPPGDPSAAKCRACAFRTICDDAAI